MTVFPFQNNTKIAINIHLLEIFALLLVFSYQFTAKCLSLPPPLLGGAISKPLTLPFALAFRTSNIETVVRSPVSLNLLCTVDWFITLSHYMFTNQRQYFCRVKLNWQILCKMVDSVILSHNPFEKRLLLAHASKFFTL